MIYASAAHGAAEKTVLVKLQGQLVACATEDFFGGRSKLQKLETLPPTTSISGKRSARRQRGIGDLRPLSLVRLAAPSGWDLEIERRLDVCSQKNSFRRDLHLSGCCTPTAQLLGWNRHNTVRRIQSPETNPPAYIPLLLLRSHSALLVKAEAEVVTDLRSQFYLVKGREKKEGRGDFLLLLPPPPRLTLPSFSSDHFLASEWLGPNYEFDN